MAAAKQPNFSQHLFWDVDVSKLDFDKSTRYIIERVVTRGALPDWYQLLNYYGKEKIKDTCSKLKYLDNITLSFLSCFFNLPKENFRCYKLKQSTQELWPY